MLNFACRNHIYELMLRAVIEIYSPETTGPDMPTFKHFQQKWQSINQSEYSIGLEDELIVLLINDDKWKNSNFVLNRVKVMLRQLLQTLYLILILKNDLVILLNFSGITTSRWLRGVFGALLYFLRCPST